jgi:hypothetical protein
MRGNARQEMNVHFQWQLPESGGLALLFQNDAQQMTGCASGVATYLNSEAGFDPENITASQDLGVAAIPLCSDRGWRKRY